MAVRLPEDESEGFFSEINITPLTDIFLVLLIIFMVCSSILVDVGATSGLKVNLPSGTSRELAPGADTLVVGVSADDEFVVEGKKLNREGLTEVFASTSAKSKETQVVIQADRECFHGTVVQVMELARKAGLHKLGIATRAEE